MTSLLRAPSTQPMFIPLHRPQLVLLILFGVALWFLAAVLLRVLGPLGVYEGMGRVVLYVLIVPGTVPFLLIAARLACLARSQIALGAAVMTAIATLLDGIALAWFPMLYGTDSAQIAGAGATILWGAGVGLVLGFAMNRTERT